MNLDGAVTIVTGGGRGLGLAIATFLHDRGASVVVLDRDPAALGALPAGLLGQCADVASPASARAAAEDVVNRHGRIDVLVNNAGVIYSEPLVSLMRPSELMHDYERFRRSVHANLDTVFVMTAAVVEQMVRRRSKGAIVNISSISAHGNEGQTAYSAAKAAVEAMTVTWAKELGRLGIRCNAVAPGFMDTDSTHSALSEDALKHIRANTPLRRLGRSEEVAQAVMAAITNDFMNGAVLRVDGGLRI